jgi:uncharacterized phage-associated protein
MALPVTVSSTFDVVYWFYDRALNDGEYLQPQKLQRLLYLCQAYWAVAYNGRMLMPAVFVADEMGPQIPDIYRAFEMGRPNIEPRKLADTVAQFVDGIWRRFGPHSTEHLNGLIRTHSPYVDALRKGIGCEITLKAMRDFYGASQKDDNAPGAPAIGKVLRPRVMRNADGKPVSVQRWLPPAKSDKKPGKG